MPPLVEKVRVCSLARLFQLFIQLKDLLNFRLHFPLMMAIRVPGRANEKFIHILAPGVIIEEFDHIGRRMSPPLVDIVDLVSH